MINKLSGFFSLFQQGKELANAKEWKNIQATSNTLLSVMTSAIVIADAFGYSITVDPDTLTLVAGIIATLYGAGNAIITVITSSKVGVKPKKVDGYVAK